MNQVLADTARVFSAGFNRWASLSAIIIVPPLVILHLAGIKDDAMDGLVLTLATLPGYVVLVRDIWESWRGQAGTVWEACVSVEIEVLIQAVLLALLVNGGALLLGAGLGVLGIGLMTAWLLATIIGDQIVILEGARAMDAIKRSWELVRPVWGLCLGVLLVSMIIQMLVVALTGGVSPSQTPVGENLTGPDEMVSLWVQVAPIVRWGLYLVMFPFLAVLQTVVYYDLRVMETGDPEAVLAVKKEPEVE